MRSILLPSLASIALLASACGGNDFDPNDADRDGFTIAQGDCNDNNSAVYPGAPEPCDGLDNNCEGTIDEGFDNDNDTFTTCGGDCRDNDPGSNPIQAEIIDGIDNDCDGIADNHTDQYDDDGDGFSEDQGDCDDNESDGASIGPNALEVQVDANGDPQGIDDDCDGIVDEAPIPCPTDRNLSDPFSYAHAIDICNELNSASWTSSVNIDSRSRNIVEEFGDSYMPKFGQDMVVLSTGLAVDRNDMSFDDASTDLGNSTSHPDPQPDPGDGCGQADGSTVNDYSELKLVLDVPANAKSLSFDFNFMSIEFPEFVCSSFDDTFLAMLDSKAFQGNVSFDDQGNRVSINIGFFDVCQVGLAPTCTGQDELLGTGFETVDTDDGGGTGWLTTTAPVSPGEKATLTFMIFDEGDHVLDSAVLIDNFRWGLEEIEDPITVERTPRPEWTGLPASEPQGSGARR